MQYTSDKFSQYVNALVLIMDTDSGIVTLFKLMHPLNTNSSIQVTLSGIITASCSAGANAFRIPSMIKKLPVIDENLPLKSHNLGQLENALHSMNLTLSGIIIDRRLMQPENAYFSIDSPQSSK